MPGMTKRAVKPPVFSCQLTYFPAIIAGDRRPHAGHFAAWERRRLTTCVLPIVAKSFVT
jgi:hypothetical protein